MRAYETVFVLQPELEKEVTDSWIEKVKGASAAAGEVGTVDEWGKRKLAYEIDKKYTEGYYVVIEFKAEQSVLDSLDYLFKMNEEFIRSIIVKKEK